MLEITEYLYKLLHPDTDTDTDTTGTAICDITTDTTTDNTGTESPQSSLFFDYLCHHDNDNDNDNQSQSQSESESESKVDFKPKARCVLTFTVMAATV